MSRVTWKVIFEAGLVEEFEDQKVRGNTNVVSVAIGCNAGQRVGAWEVQPSTALHAPFSVSHRSFYGSRSSSMLKCGLIYGHSTYREGGRGTPRKGTAQRSLRTRLPKAQTVDWGQLYSISYRFSSEGGPRDSGSRSGILPPRRDALLSLNKRAV